MADPASTSTVGMTSLFGFSAIGVLSGAHPTAIWGALIGAFIYIIAVPEHKPLKKVCCLLASWSFGYYIALEAIGQGVVKTEGAIACFSAAICLPIAFGFISFIRSGKAFNLFSDVVKRIFGTRGGREDDR